uniref:Uncharacterized protein n=1 Tax=Strongyloides papillosus TaxID=174720 RepID=A0A0N5C6D5_STREA
MNQDKTKRVDKTKDKTTPTTKRHTKEKKVNSVNSTNQDKHVKKKEKKKEKKEDVENHNKNSKEVPKKKCDKPTMRSNPSQIQDQPGYQCLYMAPTPQCNKAANISQEANNFERKFDYGKPTTPMAGNKPPPPQQPQTVLQTQVVQGKDDLYENLSVFRNG